MFLLGQRKICMGSAGIWLSTALTWRKAPSQGSRSLGKCQMRGWKPKAEVQRLLDAGVIRLVPYTEWLANVVIVMVMKKNGKWRMCVDFSDLNKHCPKDPHPLPRIDKVVDIAACCEMMSLLDCFSSYHQIWLNPKDEEKQVLSHLVAHTVITTCRRDCAMPAQHSLEWRMDCSTSRKGRIY